MKTLPFRIGLRPALFLLAACTLGAVPATAKDNGSRRPATIAKLADRDVVIDALAESTDAWNSIKDYSYEKRADFTAIFSRLLSRLDDDIRSLNAKRAVMTNDPKNWDFAMKELNNARADVQSKLTEVSKASTPETWTEARDRLGVAWERAQLAVRNVKTSTTS